MRRFPKQLFYGWIFGFFIGCQAFMLYAQTEDGYAPEILPEESVIPTGTLFVSPGGSDETGDGSFASPYKTIEYALEIADSGDVINCREGVYASDGIRFRKAGITLQSHPGEWAVIQVPVVVDESDIAVYLDTNASHSVLRRLEIIGGYYYGVSTETRWDWGDPEDRTGCSHILIEDCVIHDTGHDCIKIKPNCNDITIRNCEIYNSGQAYPPGETEGNAEGIDNVNGDFMVVQDCSIHDILSTGVYFKGGAMYGVVERCRIQGCGEGGVMVGFDTSPEFFDLDVNPHYYENIAGIVRNCLIEDTRYAGIGLYAAKGARILNNTLIDVARDGHSALYCGITFQDWEDEAGRPASTDACFYNNLIYLPEESEALAFSIRYADELGGLSGYEGMPAMDHNLYFHAGGSALFEDNRPGSLLENGSFSDWQQHITGDMHSEETDPLLDENGYPAESSPAKDSGLAYSLVSYDLDQKKRSGACDIGAIEVNGETGITEIYGTAGTFALGAYPNPSNNRTLVQWHLPESGEVELTLFDATGRKVRTIAHSFFESGNHEIPVDFENLPSGLYIAALRSEKQSACSKILLIR